MYTLLSGLYHYLTQKEEYYVLIIGLDNAGKTVSEVFPPFLLYVKKNLTFFFQSLLDFIRTHKVNLYGCSWSRPRQDCTYCRFK